MLISARDDHGRAFMKNRRVCACAGLASAALLAVSVLAGAAQAAEMPDIFGTFWAARYNAKIQLVGGGELPLTAAGKAAYDKNIAGLKDGSLADDARHWCVPDGLPRVLATPYPFEIVQGLAGAVLMIHELNHEVRSIRLDKPM